ncbi:MAG: hypothetical protein J6Q05_00255 [Elusimicrobiaceae bacterium]|nr:hypothetical protein [Elusimicrobiaceae bacterium]
MRYICLLAGFFLFSVPIHAQFYQRTITRLMRQADVSFQRSLTAKITQPQLTRSMLLLQELRPIPGHIPFLLQASAFVIEDTYQGKKQLWGITAAHYHFQNPQLTHLYTNRRLHTQIYAQGGGGINDIAIFPIPSALKDKVVPLKLAAQRAKLGEKVHSISFFDQQIHHETDRTVQEVAPHRILTSLQVPNSFTRLGACGSPILNEQNEVLGVHVSSSCRHQTGGVVPADHIRSLLEAYHQKTSLQQPIYFNGTQLTTLGINEFIRDIFLFKGHTMIHNVPLSNHNKTVDYDHLEKLLDTTGGTQVIFVIEQQPLLPLVQGHKAHTLMISYDLKTKEVTKIQRD